MTDLVRFTLDVQMSLRCLSRAELILLKLSQCNLNRDLLSFFSRSLLYIFLSLTLLLLPLLSRFRVFLSHFSAFFCGAPHPLSLALVTPTFFGSLQGPLIHSWKLSWCVFSIPFFQASSFNYQNRFSLSCTYLLPLCVLPSYLLSLSPFPSLFLNLYPFVTGYL